MTYSKRKINLLNKLSDKQICTKFKDILHEDGVLKDPADKYSLDRTIDMLHYITGRDIEWDSPLTSFSEVSLLMFNEIYQTILTRSDW